MAEWLVLALVVLALATTIAAAVVRKRTRERVPMNLRELRDSSLPPITADETLHVFDAARRAAHRKLRGGADPPNPYAAGTRAHILWETQYCCTLLEMTQTENSPLTPH